MIHQHWKIGRSTWQLMVESTTFDLTGRSTWQFFSKHYGWFMNANVIRHVFFRVVCEYKCPSKGMDFQKKTNNSNEHDVKMCGNPNKIKKVIKQQHQKQIGHWSRNVEGVATQPGTPERHSSCACYSFFPSPCFLSVVPLPFWILLDFLLGAWHFSAATCHLLPCLCLQ